MATLRISGGTITLPSGTITDDAISTTAAIDVDKMQVLMKPFTNFGFAFDATPTTRTEVVFIASSAGVIRGFHAGLYDTGTSTSVAFDMKKNGTTVLSSAVTVTHSQSDRSINDGTISVTSVAADDVITFVMTVSSSTGAQGPFAFAEIQEVPA